MRSYTQISSGSQSDELQQLKINLKQLDISVTDTPSYENSESPWQTYNEELAFYKSIAKSSFHILNHDVTAPSLLQTLYAMYKQRPIIMIGRFHYNGVANSQLTKIFEAHARQFHAINLVKLEFAELSFMLNKLKPSIDYKLTPDEEKIIVSAVREYLYDRIGQGLNEMNSALK